MTKQTVVIKVSMHGEKYYHSKAMKIVAGVFCFRLIGWLQKELNGEKCRSKAVKIAVGVPGVESAALQGQEKDQIEVKGEGIDAVALTRLLRKKVGYAELVKVSPADEKKEEKKDEPKVHPLVWNPYPYPLYYEVRDTNRDPCSIM